MSENNLIFMRTSYYITIHETDNICKLNQTHHLDKDKVSQQETTDPYKSTESIAIWLPRVDYSDPPVSYSILFIKHAGAKLDNEFKIDSNSCGRLTCVTIGLPLCNTNIIYSRRHILLPAVQ